jgi:formate hydrogenlyase subunit 3/multisubunit Na+/H+ antiporter MnhD subunit
MPSPLALLVVALAGSLALATLALSCGRSRGVAHAVGVGGAFAVAAALVVAAVASLLHGTVVGATIPWSLPGCALTIEVDPLSAWFLLPIGLLAPVSALALLGFFKVRGGSAPAPNAIWFFFLLLIGSMALVVVARDALLFLIAWEGMVLASYFLMVLGASPADGERASAGGLAWLIASHLGTAFLFVLFLQRGGGPAAVWPADGAAAIGTTPWPHTAQPWSWCWLALAGFGTKAALVPFHVWAKDAYGGAPGPIAALLSGAMSKLGIYGLLRMVVVFTPREPAPPAFTWTLLAAGLASLLYGALLSLSQRDLRRVLAGTSIESAGLVTTALAVALLGKAAGANAVAVLALSAALLHVLFDATFKALLFIGAGAVNDGAGTDRLEKLGGLMKLMPATGLFFAVGAAALCGLPPFNGFISELLLITGALEGSTTQAPVTAAPLFAVVGAVALASALALASSVRAFGLAFLGVPRDPAVAATQESPATTRAALLVLALLTLATGLAAPLLLQALRPVLAALLGPESIWNFCFVGAQRLTAGAVLVSVLLALLLLAVAGVRLLLLRGRSRESTVTWDCGYHRPTARMQYTASSFSQPLATFFAPLVGYARKVVRPLGVFAHESSLETQSHDPWRARLWQPLFRLVAALTTRLRVLQHGRIHLYVLAIAATLLLLMILELAAWPGVGR